MSGAALGLACLGFLLLGFSVKRHFRQVWPESTDYSQWIVFNRIAGVMLLCLSLVPCAVAYGLGIGLAVWAGILVLAALLQKLLLTFWPSRATFVSGASAVLVVAGLLSAGLV